MQLVILHRIMIATAIIFCLGFGAVTLSGGNALLGGFFLAAGLALAGYLVWFLKKKADFIPDTENTPEP